MFYIGFILLLLPFSAKSDQYICTTDKATGFFYEKNKKEWISTNFKSEDKFVIKQTKPIKENSFSTYEVTKFGDESPMYRCNYSSNDNPIIRCSLRTSFFPNIFYYSKTTGQFQEYVHGTLVTGQTSDTPYIAIGKCSPF
jgi:hypothetical protein